MQAGWNGWTKVSGVICNRKLPARVKGKLYSLVVRLTMVYGLEMVAVTKKQVEEMEITDMKMLRFAMGVMREDKIRKEYIRSTVKVERLGMKIRESRLRWYEYVMRPRNCRKKDDGNGVAGKEEKRETKEKIFGCGEGGYGKGWCKGDRC